MEKITDAGGKRPKYYHKVKGEASDSDTSLKSRKDNNNNNNNNLFYNRFAFTYVRQISTSIALLGRTYYRDSFETKFGLSTMVVSITL